MNADLRSGADAGSRDGDAADGEGRGVQGFRSGPLGDLLSKSRAAETPRSPPVAEMRIGKPGPARTGGKADPISARGREPSGPADAPASPPGPGKLARPGAGGTASAGGGGKAPPDFHKRLKPEDFPGALRRCKAAVRGNMFFIMVLTCATNLLILAIPIYLFQISDRVLTSRSVDTLIMLTVVIGGAVALQAVFDAIRRFMLMRTAVEVAAQLGAPILSAAASASLHSNGREYQTLGDLQQVRGDRKSTV